MTLSVLPMHKSIGRDGSSRRCSECASNHAAALATKASHQLELGSIDNISMWACIAPAQLPPLGLCGDRPR
jgi:hypothetical protein